MQIVIDIPEDVIESAKSSPNYYPTYHFEKIWRAIAKGIPLPKGHGRLIDADEMKTMKNIQSANFNAVELIRYWIDNQPTIIEADKESEGEA